MHTVAASEAGRTAPAAASVLGRHRDDVGVVACSLVLYLLTTPRQVGLEDAALFGLACMNGDVAHAPGYALYSLVCPLFAHLPGVEPVVGLGIFSAVTAAVALVLLRRLLAGLLPALAANLATLAYGASLTFWSQAIIPEVYALNAALTVASLLVLRRFSVDGAPHRMPLLALLVGLGLSTHWPLYVASGPAFLVLLLPRLRTAAALLAQPRWLAATLLAFAAGLLPLAWLVWRLFHPNHISMLGAADSLADVVAYLARTQYVDIDRSQWALPNAETAWLGWLLDELARQFTPFLLPVVGIGAVTCLRRSPWLAAGLGVLFACHSVVLALALEFPFDYAWQGVFRPYLLVAWLAAAVWLGFGIDVLGTWLRARVTPRAVPVLLSLLPVVAVVANLPYNDRARNTFAEVHARLVLESLPRDAVLVVSGDSFLPLGYLHELGVAPDVELRELHGLLYPNRLFTPDTPLADQYAQWAHFVDAAGRPVFFTHWIDIGRSASLHGWLVRMHPQGEPGRPGCVAMPRQDAFVADLLRVRPLHPAERMHRHDVLMAASFCLTARAATEPEAGSLLRDLEQDPTGGLASIAWLLTQPQTPERDQTLQRLAALATAADPEVFSSRQRAMRETLLGKVALTRGQAGHDVARKHFVRAVALRDPPRNGAHLALAKLYVEGGYLASLAEMLTRFPQLPELQPFRRYLPGPAAGGAVGDPFRADAASGPATSLRSAPAAPASR